MKKKKSSALSHKKTPAQKVIAAKSKKQQTTSGNERKLVTENLQLRVELEHKNRELEIEAELERVRTVVMSLRKADDLVSVCESLYTSLIKLGLKNIRNAQIVINDDARQLYVNYESVSRNKASITEVPYKSHRLVQELVNKMKRSKNAFVSVTIIGRDLIEWQKYRQHLGQKKDNKLAKAKAVCYYFYSVGTGALGISAFDKISSQQLHLLQRFRNVFTLAYKRFEEIQKAEALAREAQIEASLERVRSRSIAMQKSFELADVVHVMDLELARLGIQVDSTTINTDFSVKGNGFNLWVARKGRKLLDKFYVPEGDNQVHKKIRAAIKNKIEYYSDSYGKAEKDKYYKWLFKFSDFKKLEEERKKSILTSSGWTRATALCKNSFLAFHRYQLKDYTSGEANIFKRFAKVFEQTYARFLDLQKAEEQAKEAQIETALERVRSRSTEMKKSNELADVVFIMNKELIKLGIQIDNTSINTDFSMTGNGWNVWLARKGQQYLEKFHIPEENPIHQQIRSSIEKGIEFYTESYNKAEKDKYFKWLFKSSDLKKLEVDRKRYIFSTPGWTRATILSKNSLLIFQRYKQTNFTEEEVNIFKRFARVFEQAYTRFLDLQKAEAQEREAQIEAALEKIRSASLAMQQSRDISMVVETVDKKLKELGLSVSGGITITIFQENSKDFINWMVVNDNGFKTEEYYQQYFDSTIFRDFYDARSNGLDYVNKVYDEEDTKDHLQRILSQPSFQKTPKHTKEWLLSQSSYAYAAAISKYSGIFVFYFDGVFLSQEIGNILRRVAHVFEQAYVRFIDLKQAEAQTREAKIEAALERVRAKSMAMHRSDELAQVALSVDHEIAGLGIAVDNTIIISDFRDVQQGLNTWLSVKEKNYLQKFHIPAGNKHPVSARWVKAITQNETHYVEQYSKTEKNKYYKWVFKCSDFKSLPEDRKTFVLDQKGWTRAFFLSPNSVLSVEKYNLTNFSIDEIEVFKRFSIVFDQAYTRFLDLQKAEAQAREAQIQLALERVRARSLAMHSTNELVEIVDTVFNQLGQLGFNLDGSAVVINLFTEGSKDILQWIVDADHKFPYSFHHPHFDNPILNDIQNAREKNLDYFSNTYSFEEKNRFWNYYFKHTDFKRFPENLQKEILAKESYAQSMALEKHSGILNPNINGIVLGEEQKEILKRFAKVFEQAYIRFLDLQKAEAQAKEAQIQLALERVRARTMAMQKSEELSSLINEVFVRLTELDLKMDSATMLIIDKKTNFTDYWIAAEKFNYSTRLSVPPLTEGKMAKHFQAAWQSKEDFICIYNQKDKNDYLNFLFTSSDFRKLPDDRKQFLLNTKVYNLAYTFMEDGALVMTRFTEEAFTTTEHQTLKRFAKVFEQSYTRFLDLQKAEAQAREVQIQLALERVRARTMAMHKSSELSQVVKILFEEYKKLQTDEQMAILARGFICIINEPNGCFDL